MQCVRPEIQEIAVLLLRDSAAAQPRGLLQKYYFAAIARQSISSREPG
jgi:hypothetical protein